MIKVMEGLLNRPKVLFLNSGALPLPAVKGGAVETLLDYLAQKNEEYKQMQLEVISIYNKDAEHAAKEYLFTNYNYINVPRIVSILDGMLYKFVNIVLRKKNNIQFSHAFTMLYFYNKISKILAKKSYDKVILEVNGSLFLSLKMRKNYKKYKDKYYYYMHSQGGSSYGCKEIIRSCKKVICVSDYISKSVPEYMNSMKSQQFTVLLNGIDINKFGKKQDRKTESRLKVKYGIKPYDKLILFTGRLTPEKGIRELLEAFLILNDHNTKLLIVGSFFFGKDISSPFKKEMEVLVNKIKNRVCFTGYIPYNEMPLIYSMADIAVLPSICNEAAGLTVIESMASGLPVITTNAGGIPEYANDECAFILQRDENLVANIVSCLKKLLDDNELRKKMGQKSRIAAEQFNLDNYYNNFLKAITMP